MSSTRGSDVNFLYERLGFISLNENITTGFTPLENPIQIQTCLFHTTLAELKRIY